ncbi:MAG: hypothetical protein V1692_02750 [bacterium]
MLDATFFLTKVLGFFMLVIGLSVLIKGKTLSKIMREFTSHEYMQYFGGIINLLIGLLLVAYHNVWALPLNVLLVTIIGWATLLKGLAFLLLPEDSVSKMVKAFDNKTWHVLAGVLSLVIGVYFIYTWFTAVS